MTSLLRTGRVGAEQRLCALAPLALAAQLVCTSACHESRPREPERARSEPAPCATARSRTHVAAAPVIVASTAGEAPATSEPMVAPVAAVADELPAPARELQIRRIVLTRRIIGREPADAGPLSADGSPLYAFIELANGGAEPQQIVLSFEREGEPALGNVKLEVPAHNLRYRTWGQTQRIRTAGEWAAVVRTSDGRELGRQVFRVSAS